MALSFLNSQLPSLIEKFEPEIEKALRSTLKSVKASNPREADLFYTNWKRLSKAIDEELGSPAPTSVPAMAGGVSSDPIVPFVAEPVPAEPPLLTETGPTGPVSLPPAPEASGPSFMQETGPTGPTVIQRITEYFSETGPTGPMGGKKPRKRKTAKQHKKRTHRIKHKKQ
jgi:hypothetical protein